METNKIQVVNEKFDYSLVPEYVDMIVEGSFDTDGTFHKYLFDYCIAVVILDKFTDYSGDISFNEIIQIYNSKQWDEIVKKIGENVYCYIYQCAYVEISDKKSTSHKVNEVIRKFGLLVETINNTVEQFNNNKVKDFIDNLDVDAVNKFAKIIGK